MWGYLWIHVSYFIWIHINKIQKIDFFYEFINLFTNNIQLTRECISAIEKFQVTMQDKESYIAFYEWCQIPLSFDAMTTSPCEAMNSHIKEKMGCLSNTNTSKSLMFMAKGSIHRIEEFEKNAHRELQNSSLCSKLVDKDDVTHECLYLCNQNFDRRHDYMCAQCLEDDRMVCNFNRKKYHDSKSSDNNFLSVAKFKNVYHIRVKRFMNMPFFAVWLSLLWEVSLSNIRIHILYVFTYYMKSMTS